MKVNFLGYLKKVKADKNSAETKEKIEQGLYYDVSEIDAKMKSGEAALYAVKYGSFITDNCMQAWNFKMQEDKKKLDSLQVDYDILQKKYDMLLERYNSINNEENKENEENTNKTPDKCKARSNWEIIDRDAGLGITGYRCPECGFENWLVGKPSGECPNCHVIMD